MDTSASILLVNVGSTLRGRILDLSLGGCRIRTDERFPVGIYTRVETEFRLEGLPFRLGGVIQAIYDRNMVGIRFLDLSERKRQQVLDLIGEIEQMRSQQKFPSKSAQRQNKFDDALGRRVSENGAFAIQASGGARALMRAVQRATGSTSM